MLNTNMLYERAWLEIDLDTLAQNVKAVKALVRPNTELMGVVKADAYGHGVLQCIPTMIENGVNRLAVAILDEALQLREAGVTLPILVLGATNPRRLEEVIQYDITQTIFNWDLVKALSDMAVKLNKPVRIHLKIDTGMSRLGFSANAETIELIKQIHALPMVIVEGIFTHFASADEKDETFTRQQFAMFISMVTELNQIGLNIPLKHCCNSAAAVNYPEMQLDMVRVGLLLYGLKPEVCFREIPNLKAAMSLKSSIVQTKKIKKGVSIGYNQTYRAKKDLAIATISIGYADGFSRRLSHIGEVLLHGERCKLLGNICMDMCVIETEQFKDQEPIEMWEEVVLFGIQKYKNKTAELSAAELAKWLGTIHYEVVCTVGKRLPKFYLLENKVQDVERTIRIE